MSQNSTFFILGLEIRGTGVENVTEDKNRTQLYKGIWFLMLISLGMKSNHSEKERKGKPHAARLYRSME